MVGESWVVDDPRVVSSAGQCAGLDILGGIDVLVDNTGSQRRVPDGVLAMTDDDWTGDLPANLFAATVLRRRTDRDLPRARIAAWPNALECGITGRSLWR